jgi:hypothetical protein
VGEDGARVATTWSDLDKEGEMRTDDMTWMVRRGEEGWRIVGVAAVVFEGEPPLLLNFEDPEDMIRQQQMLKEEIVRRAQQEAQQAQQPGQPPKSIRR